MAQIIHPGVEEYLFQLPASIQPHAEIARQLILASSPEIKESYKYKLPFYVGTKNICYLIHTKKEGLYIGFMQGKRMLHNIDYLVQGDRKHILGLPIPTDREIDEERILSCMEEALAIDETFGNPS